MKTFRDGRLAAAIELTRLAGRATLEHFGRPIDVDRKDDNSPVTIADRGAEQLIRQHLSQRFPNDAILGEEFGMQAGSSDYQWIVDPIDGTKSFITGVPLYSTLLAVQHRGQTVMGVIFIPALDELVFAADGHGAWHCLAGKPPARCQVSQRTLDKGAFLMSQADLFARQNALAAYQALEREAYVTRTWGDGYGYLLVATGRAELMVDPIANPWDLAAPQIIIDQAGGRFTDWQGNATAFGGNGIGSNAIVHQRALDCCRSLISNSE
ncbi:MAG: inositol monophosphatase family protein [Pirellulaceae bacterium]|nr:inositol monophosphatase family protein [Pirellulaceae bacterium]